MKISLIIPVYNERPNLERLLAKLDSLPEVSPIFVNNGSSDGSGQFLRQNDKVVLDQPKRGYGNACSKGAAYAIQEGAELLAFMDADGSDHPEDLRELIKIADKGSDLVIGSRVLKAEKGALMPVARFGNWLTTRLLKVFYPKHSTMTDLGPLRVIRADAFQKLEMQDPDFGWTIEMQAKAILYGLDIQEKPVHYSKRFAGKSKISGTITGSFLAGKKILYTLFKIRILKSLGLRKNSL